MAVGAAGIAAGGRGCSDALARLVRRPEEACSAEPSGTVLLSLGLRFFEDVPTADAGAEGESNDGPEGAPAGRADLAAWRAEERVVGLFGDMSKYWGQSHCLLQRCAAGRQAE